VRATVTDQQGPLGVGGPVREGGLLDADLGAVEGHAAPRPLDALTQADEPAALYDLFPIAQPGLSDPSGVASWDAPFDEAVDTVDEVVDAVEAPLEPRRSR